MKTQSDDKRQLNMREELIQVEQMKNLQYEAHNKFDSLNAKAESIQSENIIPGDIIILKEGDVVPCDCVLILGEAVVDESYISGENYLIRKMQLENYQYSKDREKTFLLYLGTTITKVKTHSKLRKNSMRP